MPYLVSVFARPCLISIPFYPLAGIGKGRTLALHVVPDGISRGFSIQMGLLWGGTASARQIDTLEGMARRGRRAPRVGGNFVYFVCFASQNAILSQPAADSSFQKEPFPCGGRRMFAAGNACRARALPLPYLVFVFARPEKFAVVARRRTTFALLLRINRR